MTDPELLATFERRFRADPDPWRFDDSAYEAAKRAATLEACGPREGRRILELGAANGVLAAELAPGAEQLVAVEAVPAAAALARERPAAHPRAEVIEGLIPGALPQGSFDLVVASEILYYLDAASYRATLAALAGLLAPGGRIVAVHWRPPGPERPRTAAQVHEDLARLPGLQVDRHRETPDYLLTVLAPGVAGAPERDPESDPADRPAWVVVPARDEVGRIADALKAIDVAARAARGRVHVVVDDASTDGTGALATRWLRDWAHGGATVLAGPGAGSGPARRAGLEHALREAPEGALIATTDADSLVPADWLAALHGHLDRGAQVVAGDVRLLPGTDPRLVGAREARLAHRLAELRRLEPAAPHPHFAGASLGFRAGALAALGPLPEPEALEDDALLGRCRERGIAVVRDAAFPVATSARLQGRATLGLATALAGDAARLGLPTPAADDRRATPPQEELAS